MTTDTVERPSDRLAFLQRGGKLPVVRGKCRVCLVPLPKRRRGFCSDFCRDLYYMATSSEFLRHVVFERDKGVCASCEVDCDRLEIRVWGFSTMAKKLSRMQHRRAIMLPAEMRTEKVTALKKLGWPLTSNHPRSLWSADHRIPLADGGSYSVKNIQTLCLLCHQEKTTDEAKFRAKQRRIIGKKQSKTMVRFRRLGLL